MDDLQKHIKQVARAIEAWLHPENRALKEAIDRTVEEGLFSFQDIKHRILHLKQSLTEENLARWALPAEGRSATLIRDKTAVCLHAGNLPLVGLQDALAVILSGAGYVGKVSRKDPYLLPTLFQKLEEQNVPGVRAWSDSLNDLGGYRADSILFAGSQSSVQSVISALEALQIADSETPRLMRTAHFSIAYITDESKEAMEELTRAVFRYGGTGCRSVAIVVAPFGLHSKKCHLTDYVEVFWLDNPQHRKPPPALFHRYAANKALGVEQSWLNDFLIEERTARPEDKFVLQWVEGGPEKLQQVLERYGDGLQTVYTQTGQKPEGVRVPEGVEFDRLSRAQTPDIGWKPDGVDTIKWLRKVLS